MKKNILVVLLLFFFFLLFSFAGAYENVSLHLFDSGTPLNNLLSKYFNIESSVVVTVAQNCSIVDDVITTFMISSMCGENPIKINMMRRESKSWNDIMNLYNVDSEDLFFSISLSKVPQKYKWVYGEYYKAQKGQGYEINLYDKNVRELCNIKFLVDCFKFSPLYVMNKTDKGFSFIDLIATKISLEKDEPQED